MNKAIHILPVLLISFGIPGSELDNLIFTPVSVGNGTLLFITHPEDTQGNSVSGGGPRAEVLYIYDPTLHKTPQRLWSGGNPRPSPIKRLKPNVILMEYKYHTFLLNLKKGEVTPLLPGDNQTEVIRITAVRVDSILFFLFIIIKLQTLY